MRLTELWIYPVKSCRGLRVDAADVVRRGLRHDRRWMLVDEAGRFVTQRELPAMTHLVCALEADGIVVRAPAGEPLLLPFSFEAGERVEVTVWRHEGPAVVHDEASRWFSERLGRPLRAVFMPDDVERAVAVNPTHARPGDVVSFADGYPMLVISQASLDGLNARLPVPVAMERFRPNLVVDGVPAHDEDAWDRVRFGDVVFRGVKPCPRCPITTVDPDTGERGQEPLRTLTTYRRGEEGVLFGMSLVHEGEGRLMVGMSGVRVARGH